jgi:hypothetical protein
LQSENTLDHLSQVTLQFFITECFLFVIHDKLTCLINDSVGVVATNTAAVQLANARDKPWLDQLSCDLHLQILEWLLFQRMNCSWH